MGNRGPIRCAALCGRMHSPYRALCPECWALVPDWLRGGVEDAFAWLLDCHRHRPSAMDELRTRLRRYRLISSLAAEEAHYRAMYPEDKCPPST